MAAPWRDSDYKDRSPLEYRVYVGNLPFSANDRSLKDSFANYGAISAEVGLLLLRCIQPFPRRSCFRFRSVPGGLCCRLFFAKFDGFLFFFLCVCRTVDRAFRSVCLACSSQV
jgi:RNA recognition motif-containing protein